MTALTICNTAVHQLDGLYSLNDLHVASGGERQHQPSNFLRNEQALALIAEIDKSSDLRISHKTIRGSKGGTYVSRELVYAYANWISPAFYLKMIRAFDALQKVGAGGTALPAKDSLDADTISRINRHAWALAQATFERFRREMTADIEKQWHRTAVEDWKPKEYREEFFHQLAANAEISRTFGDSINRNAAKLAAMAGVDYAAVSAKYRAV